MQCRVLTAAVGLVLTLSLTPLVTGCQSADANGRDDSAPGTADGTGDGSGAAAPGSSGGSGTSGASSAAVPSNTSPSSGAKGGKPSGAPSSAPSGLPPQPDTESRAAYAAALDAIDPRIVGGDPAGAVERGRTTCQAIAAHMNHTKLITQTKQKFARPGYTVSNAHAEAIVRAANTHLCPSSGA